MVECEFNSHVLRVLIEECEFNSHVLWVLIEQCDFNSRVLKVLMEGCDFNSHVLWILIEEYDFNSHVLRVLIEECDLGNSRNCKGGKVTCKINLIDINNLSKHSNIYTYEKAVNSLDLKCRAGKQLDKYVTTLNIYIKHMDINKSQ